MGYGLKSDDEALDGKPSGRHGNPYNSKTGPPMESTSHY
jgi:hypothetical protein